MSDNICYNSLTHSSQVMVKSHTRQLEHLQSMVDHEAKGKSDALKAKHLLDATVADLEDSLQQSHEAQAEQLKQIKKLQGRYETLIIFIS